MKIKLLAIALIIFLFSFCSKNDSNIGTLSQSNMVERFDHSQNKGLILYSKDVLTDMLVQGTTINYNIELCNGSNDNKILDLIFVCNGSNIYRDSITFYNIQLKPYQIITLKDYMKIKVVENGYFDLEIWSKDNSGKYLLGIVKDLENDFE